MWAHGAIARRLFAEGNRVLHHGNRRGAVQRRPSITDQLKQVGEPESGGGHLTGREAVPKLVNEHCCPENGAVQHSDEGEHRPGLAQVARHGENQDRGQHHCKEKHVNGRAGAAPFICGPSGGALGAWTPAIVSMCVLEGGVQHTYRATLLESQLSSRVKPPLPMMSGLSKAAPARSGCFQSFLLRCWRL